MQLRPKRFVLALMTAVALLGADKADQGQVMLEAARKKEVVDGDLKAAIEQYKVIASKYASERSVAADALIRMVHGGE